jgi:hypothetical protein
VRYVRVTLDGRQLRRTTRTRFSLRVDPRRLRGGRHTLRFIVVDSPRGSRTVVRRFTRCTIPQGLRPQFTG